VIIAESPGPLSTVQDLGRPGFAHLGVSASGAADALALRAGNRLAGNPDGAPALEMTLTGGAFRFERDAVAVLAGSDFGMECWRPFRIRAGDTLRLGPSRTGARGYLCVRGGIDVPLVLGSASTHVVSGLGGRPLRPGDTLAIGPEPQRPPLWRGVRLDADRLAPLRITRGPHAAWFRRTLDGLTYHVREESNRMGLRLKGPRFLQHGEMLTEGATLGAIQIPPSGEPIVLFVEHQTTGGYPIIANLISADLWKAGQLRPRDPVRFETVTLERARALLIEQEAWLDGLA
jgi:biotin-dependent carboxylase-like uncharacterized protein